MPREETKYIYRSIAQSDGITLTAQLNGEMTQEEAEAVVLKDVFLAGTDHYKPYVLLPIATQEAWEAGAVNFCPRCGNSMHDMEMTHSEHFDCDNCEANVGVYISLPEDEED